MKKMRRGFALALASAMVLLTACGGSQGASGSAAPRGHTGHPGP